MKVIPACDQAALAGVLDVGWSMPAALVDEVAAIIGDIDARGDDALLGGGNDGGDLFDVFGGHGVGPFSARLDPVRFSHYRTRAVRSPST